MKTIKIGSVGSEVVTLQEILKLITDGIFGPVTEKAVIEFQILHGLVADGIVGPITWNVLLSADSDSDNFKNSQFVEYIIPAGKQITTGWLPNYFPGPFKKRWLIFHHTAGGDNPYQVADFFANDNNSVATEFIVGGLTVTGKDNGNDGIMVRCIPKDSYAYHAGVGNTQLHKESIGVEICSYGGLTKGGYNKIVDGKYTWIALQKNTFYTAYGNPVSDSEVFDLGYVYRFNQYFHKYSLKQVESCQKIIEYCKEEHGMDIMSGLIKNIKKLGVEKAFGFMLQEANLVPGIYTHGNVFQGKNDIYPDPTFIEMLMSV